MNYEYLYFANVLIQLAQCGVSNKDLDKVCKKNIKNNLVDLNKLLYKYDLDMKVKDNLEIDIFEAWKDKIS